MRSPAFTNKIKSVFFARRVTFGLMWACRCTKKTFARTHDFHCYLNMWVTDVWCAVQGKRSEKKKWHQMSLTLSNLEVSSPSELWKWQATVGCRTTRPNEKFLLVSAALRTLCSDYTCSKSWNEQLNNVFLMAYMHSLGENISRAS